MVLTEQKLNYLERLSTKDGVISALAFDQRGALKRLMAKYQDTEPTVAQMEELKVLVADELTKYASSMLLDPEYGLPATKALDKDAGLLLAYEKTGIAPVDRFIPQQPGNSRHYHKIIPTVTHDRNKISCPSRKLLFRYRHFPVRVVFPQIPDSELPVTCFPDIADNRQVRMKTPRSVFIAQQKTATGAPLN